MTPNIDPKVEEDLKKGIVRAVGDPDIRFGEDALRILRAIRISAELGFKIEEKTKNSIKNISRNLYKKSPQTERLMGTGERLFQPCFILSSAISVRFWLLKRK